VREFITANNFRSLFIGSALISIGWSVLALVALAPGAAASAVCKPPIRDVGPATIAPIIFSIPPAASLQKYLSRCLRWASPPPLAVRFAHYGGLAPVLRCAACRCAPCLVVVNNSFNICLSIIPHHPRPSVAPFFLRCACGFAPKKTSRHRAWGTATR